MSLAFVKQFERRIGRTLKDREADILSEMIGDAKMALSTDNIAEIMDYYRVEEEMEDENTTTDDLARMYFWSIR